jgi:hypothetical protein
MEGENNSCLTRDWLQDLFDNSLYGNKQNLTRMMMIFPLLGTKVFSNAQDYKATVIGKTLN